ncbi:MAG TPA: hypothetical protein VGZ93_05930 [Candidatus Methylacidiphilales bacterium]|jgi:hypothetical protein|nr:hypothetical protein [Candidatus Methylacidiphilales bacterium]
MPDFSFGARSRARLLGALLVPAIGALGASPVSAQNYFTPGDLLVSSSTYAGTASTITVGQALPITPTAYATNNGSYYGVFDNELPDANFGITSPITITQLTLTGAGTGVVINVPGTYLSTSFSSKSELGLNLSTDGTAVTFMAYPAVANQLDLSNSATPGNNFSGNTDVAPATYRAIGQINSDGSFTTPTQIVDYSGDNARNAILANGYYYTVGASASSAPSLAGAEIVTPGGTAGSNSTSLGTYGTKDSQNNFRGMTIFNNTLYVSKGSGGASSSVDTVYQVGTAGTLPTAGGNTISILPGFNTVTQGANSTSGPHPFGLWFANATTLYVADEGTGVLADVQSGGVSTFTGSGNNSYAGLEKWSYNASTQKWVLDYTMITGLNIGTNYSVSGTNGGVAGTYTTAPDGLRNITGRINGDGTVTIFAITSTVNGAVTGSVPAGNYAYDEGCDPNQLVSITDNIANTSPAVGAGETFHLLQTAAYGQVLRGVSFTPITVATDTPAMPVWGLCLLAGLLLLIATRLLPQQNPPLAISSGVANQVQFSPRPGGET